MNTTRRLWLSVIGGEKGEKDPNAIYLFFVSILQILAQFEPKKPSGKGKKRQRIVHCWRNRQKAWRTKGGSGIERKKCEKGRCR